MQKPDEPCRDQDAPEDTASVPTSISERPSRFYEQLMARQRYSVIRSNRKLRKIEATGLTLTEARAKAAELGAAERLAYPEKTFWTIDMFVPEMENGEELDRILSERRMQRCKAALEGKEPVLEDN